MTIKWLLMILFIVSFHSSLSLFSFQVYAESWSRIVVCSRLYNDNITTQPGALPLLQLTMMPSPSHDDAFSFPHWCLLLPIAAFSLTCIHTAPRVLPRRIELNCTVYSDIYQEAHQRQVGWCSLVDKERLIVQIDWRLFTIWKDSSLKNMWSKWRMNGFRKNKVTLYCFVCFS